MAALISTLISFLVGSIPTGYLIAKYVKKIDIRQHGSGNVGATNVLRVAGKGLGAVVFVLDFLKGLVPVLLFTSIFGSDERLRDMNVWVGLGAILGHIYSPFLRFRGGKGIATGGGVVCGTYPILFLAAILTWALAFIIFRYVSVSSLASLLALLVGCLLWREIGWNARIFFFLIVGLGFWTHRGNITRLFKGEEGKIINR